MSNEDPVLFWLSQEPVDSNADVYLPPDTPTQSHKVLSQIKKNKRIKRARTIERLKAYTFEKLQDARRTQAKNVNPAKLPPSKTPFGVIEFMEGSEFLVSQTKDIVDLLELAQRVKENGEESALPSPPPLPASEEQVDLSENNDYQYNIEKEYSNKVKIILDQYDRIVSDLVSEEDYIANNTSPIPSLQPQREEGEIDSDSSLSPAITTSSFPPLLPRVSRRDPRLTLKEYSSNKPPTNSKQ